MAARAASSEDGTGLRSSVAGGRAKRLAAKQGSVSSDESAASTPSRKKANRRRLPSEVTPFQGPDQLRLVETPQTAIHRPPGIAPLACHLCLARVYELVRKIPAGKVATYGEVARAVGCKAARPVGQAMRNNPFAMKLYPGPDYPPEMVPCHRVVSSDFSMGGFGGQTAISSTNICDKVDLLRREGVKTLRDGNKIKLARPSMDVVRLTAKGPVSPRK
ncbi:uncharacterized protein MONBRDRAFT_10336 [Monosiga brevicollis MX1]|uniref:Methylated-DNA--protein-cysteine methyltransferase n=1 Tax=Monosiga brevicollis TaxID=81824 RepID=A9V5X5_MONBE|nr:uncharacterized protein MONBRDRAFT_10336 [Monosiga brevicollis MX1]EDQ87124.1 predicted protein [Monosiga brevicollis MX1]|eukprot:XP_001748067.1 hypothetical protein [Monosiga brevicollis MX1]